MARVATPSMKTPIMTVMAIPTNIPPMLAKRAKHNSIHGNPIRNIMDKIFCKIIEGSIADFRIPVQIFMNLKMEEESDLSDLVRKHYCIIYVM